MNHRARRQSWPAAASGACRICPQAPRRDLDPGRLHRRRRRRTPPTATTAPTPRPSRSSSIPTDLATATCSSSSSRSTTRPRKNRQGNDVGMSYRSAIFYTDEQQKQVAEDTIADVDASGLWPGKVVTEVAPRARSGRPSPSTRTTSSATRTATRATSSGRLEAPASPDRVVAPLAAPTSASPGPTMPVRMSDGATRTTSPSVAACAMRGKKAGLGKGPRAVSASVKPDDRSVGDTEAGSPPACTVWTAADPMTRSGGRACPTTRRSSTSTPATTSRRSPAWELDPSHSALEFVARYAVFTLVRGRFTSFSGTVVIASAASRGDDIAVDIDASSVDTAMAVRDAHLLARISSTSSTIRRSRSAPGGDAAGRGSVHGHGRTDDPGHCPTGSARRRPLRACAGRARQPSARLEGDGEGATRSGTSRGTRRSRGRRRLRRGRRPRARCLAGPCRPGDQAS